MGQIAFIFPGQGSQFVGMGKDLYEAFPESRRIFETADKILGFSLSSLMFSGPQEELTRTKNCQPAVFVTSIAALRAVNSTLPSNSFSTRYTAGLSLGEYSALVASEVLTFKDGLKLVKKRAELMDEAAKKTEGKMSAIIGLDKAIVSQIAQATAVSIANLNCPAQVVISGETKNIEQAKRLALERGSKRVIDLEVSGAFHSSLMYEPAMQFKDFLKGFSLKIPLIPVISNVTAFPQYEPPEISENLVKQIFSPVLWENSVRFMADKGVKVFYEIGPGNVLKGIIRKIDSNLNVINIGRKEDIDKCVSV